MTEQPSPRRRILIVDDSGTIRTQIANMLQADYDCLTADDGEAALTAVRKQPPDAIISDLEMPAMNGLDLLRALRADSAAQGIPVVIMTTSTEVSRVNEARALGCAGFVLKPIREEYLLAKLRSLLRPRS